MTDKKEKKGDKKKGDKKTDSKIILSEETAEKHTPPAKDKKPKKGILKKEGEEEHDAHLSVKGLDAVPEPEHLDPQKAMIVEGPEGEKIKKPKKKKGEGEIKEEKKKKKKKEEEQKASSNIITEEEAEKHSPPSINKKAPKSILKKEGDPEDKNKKVTKVGGLENVPEPEPADDSKPKIVEGVKGLKVKTSDSPLMSSGGKPSPKSEETAKGDKIAKNTISKDNNKSAIPAGENKNTIVKKKK